MLVPFKYVRLLLQCPLSPREAWEQVARVVYNDGNEMACTPLLDWLRVCLMAHAANMPSRLVVAAPHIPLALPALTTSHWWQVTTDLPSLSGVPVTLAAHQIAVGINELVTDNRAARMEEIMQWDNKVAWTPD